MRRVGRESKELRRKVEKKDHELVKGKETGGKEKVPFQGTGKKEKELTILGATSHLVSAVLYRAPSSTQLVWY